MHVVEKPRDRGLTRFVRACAEHPWRTLGIWLVAIVVIVASSHAFGGRLVNETSIPGSDSQHAVDLLKARFPERSGDSARIGVAESDRIVESGLGCVAHADEHQERSRARKSASRRAFGHPPSPESPE